ncbi:hypothetical protein DXG03_007948, partial [Asterophora parasitica]
IGWFRSFGIDREHNFPHIATLSLALGIMYITVFAFSVRAPPVLLSTQTDLEQLFGIYSAASQRTPLVRIYTLLTVLAAFIVAAAGLTRIVTHFVWKNDIIAECTTLTTGGQIIYHGFWGPIKADTLTPSEAAAWCRRAWDRDSWSDIVGLLILLGLAALFTILAFAYQRQLQDPTSVANASRAPSAQWGGAPAHYNPPYAQYPPNTGYPANNAHLNNTGYGYSEADTFVPPYEGKSPGYENAGGAGADRKGDAEDPFADSVGEGRPRRDAGV